MIYLFKKYSIIKIGVVTCSAAVFTLAPAYAVTTTASFQVTANVITSCALTTPATLPFGNYSPSSGVALTASTTFNVVCTVGTPYSLGLDAGSSTGASVTARQMTSSTATAGSNLLAYGLFKELGRTTNWDNSVAGTGYTATGLVQPYTIYGAIPPGQYGVAAATNYADTIVLTLTY